jgi:hypothetical protein
MEEETKKLRTNIQTYEAEHLKVVQELEETKIEMQELKAQALLSSQKLGDQQKQAQEYLQNQLYAYEEQFQGELEQKDMRIKELSKQLEMAMSGQEKHSQELKDELEITKEKVI